MNIKKIIIISCLITLIPLLLVLSYIGYGVYKFNSYFENQAQYLKENDNTDEIPNLILNNFKNYDTLQLYQKDTKGTIILTNQKTNKTLKIEHNIFDISHLKTDQNQNLLITYRGGFYGKVGHSSKTLQIINLKNQSYQTLNFTTIYDPITLCLPENENIAYITDTETSKILILAKINLTSQKIEYEKTLNQIPNPNEDISHEYHSHCTKTILYLDNEDTKIIEINLNNLTISHKTYNTTQSKFQIPQNQKDITKQNNLTYNLKTLQTQTQKP